MFARIWLFIFSLIFFLSDSLHSQSCSLSDLELVSVSEVGADFDIEIRLLVGGGVLGVDRGAGNATTTFAIAIRTPGDVPLTVSNVSPAMLVGPETGGINTASITGGNPGFDSQETIGYINNGTPLECITSTAQCGTPHATEYLINFTSSVRPEEIEVMGIEGNGNAFAGCPLLIPASALPVSWRGFQINEQRDGLLLSWQTESESLNDGFYVERASTDGAWAAIGFVAGQNRPEGSDYRFVDRTPHPGQNTYRLRQVDFDGRELLSPILSANWDQSAEIVLFPNPAGAYFELIGPSISDRSLYLYDIYGRLVRTYRSQDGPVFDLRDIPVGVYQIRIDDNRSGQSLRLVVQRER